MTKHAEQETTQIVTAGPQLLTVRSSALALRGLRDLARESNWLVKKVFAGAAAGLEISPAGCVAVISPGSAASLPRLAIFDVEERLPVRQLEVQSGQESPESDDRANLGAAFAWSSSGSELIAAWSSLKNELRYFDLRLTSSGKPFGADEQRPTHLDWCHNGEFLAASRSGGTGAAVNLWKARSGSVPFSDAREAELGFPGWIERQTYEVESGEDGAFLGYGRLSFSPDGRALAVAAEFQGEWADDSIAIVDVPGMREQLTHPAQGHITDITWTPDGKRIIYCASGQAYRLDVETMEAEPLTFGAEWCACHPELPLCGCYSGWLKNSAKGRLFLVDLRTMKVFDEHAAEGVADVRWSDSGTKAYAVTRDGLAYVYEPMFL